MPFNKEGVWAPNKKQAEFLALPDSIKEAFYGGGAGSGKSEVLLVYPIVRRWYQNPKFKMVFQRRTYPELRNEIVPRSKEFYLKLGATFNKSEMSWTFPAPDQLGGRGLSNYGATIFLGHCENEDDVHQYDSMEINLYSPDELTSYLEWIYLYIGFTRVRTSDPDLPAIIRAAGMPGGIGHCVPLGELLTPNGWKDIKDIQVGDSVYEVNDQFQLEESVIEQKHEHNYNGNLYKAHTTNLDIKCTPEHRVKRLLGKKGRDNNYTLTPVNELPNQTNICRSATFNGINENYFELPDYDGRIKTEQPSILPYNLYAEFMGWFLSEGWTLDRDKCFGIAQSKFSSKDKIRTLLNLCGFKYSTSENGFIIYSAAWWLYLKQFGKSEDKFIPRDLLNSSSVALKYLFEALMDGDGYWVDYPKSGHYYTSSEKLWNDTAELAFKLGYSVKQNKRQRDNRVTVSYQIYFTSQFTTEIVKNGKRTNNVSTEYYNGKVYDIGVPKYHTFVIRQNGSVWISGNSWVNNRFVKPNKKGGEILKGRGGNLRTFVFATLADNDHIDPGYAQSLEALPEAEKRAKRYGDFDAYLGQVFEEYRDRHYEGEPENALHFIEPFDIPEWWPKVYAIDWGFAAPAMTYVCCGAISPDSRVYIYRELSWQKTKIEEWGAQLKEYIDAEDPREIKLCQSAKQERGQDHTIQQQVVTAIGRNVVLSGNQAGSRIATKLLIHEYFRWKPKYIPKSDPRQYNDEYASWILRNRGLQEYKSYISSFDQEQEEANLPKALIFKCCPLLDAAIKSCSYDSKESEDVAAFPGDDPYDAFRYLIDSVDKFFDESHDEFQKIQRTQALVNKLKENSDWTAYYRNARALETPDRMAPVARYSRFNKFRYGKATHISPRVS